jgi:hypothetical protein
MSSSTPAPGATASRKRLMVKNCQPIFMLCGEGQVGKMYASGQVATPAVGRWRPPPTPPAAELLLGGSSSRDARSPCKLGRKMRSHRCGLDASGVSAMALPEARGARDECIRWLDAFARLCIRTRLCCDAQEGLPWPSFHRSSVEPWPGTCHQPGEHAAVGLCRKL